MTSHGFDRGMFALRPVQMRGRCGNIPDNRKALTMTCLYVTLRFRNPKVEQ